MTLVEPSVSTDASRRTRVRRRDMRITPIDSAAVTTAGKLSGRAATARLTDVRKSPKIPVPPRQSEAKEQHNDRERRPKEDAAEGFQLSLERRIFLAARFGDESCDGTDFGPHSGGDHDRATRTSRHARAHEDHVAPVADREIRPIQHGGALVDGLGLAGQRGFDASERRRDQQPGVGGDEIARLEFENVSGDNFGGRNRRHRAVAPNLRPGRRQSLQGRDRLLGAELLKEANHGVQDNDGENGECVDHLAEHADTTQAPIRIQITTILN